jgi:E3 ubiquitin-protein ligase BRE1
MAVNLELMRVFQKAKAENKFYSAMRDKEAMEGEKKTFIRMLEKQGKAVEKLVDTEASLKDQIVSLFYQYMGAKHAQA